MRFTTPLLLTGLGMTLVLGSLTWSITAMAEDAANAPVAEPAAAPTAEPAAESASGDAAAEEPAKLLSPVKEEDIVVLKGGMPEVFPFPGDPRPYEKSPNAERIDKALAYILFKVHEPSRFFSLTILDFLQRKYGLHERYGLKFTFAPHLRGESDQIDEDKFGRLFYPSHQIDQEVLENAPETEKYILKAMYCDQYPLTEHDIAQYQKMADTGPSYFLYQMASAYIWMRDNGCGRGDESVLRIKDIVAAKMRRNLMDQAPRDTKGYMSVAFLYGLGNRNLVDDAWVKAIIEQQREDGGWPYSYNAEHPNPGMLDATVFALWVLLEDALPLAPDATWLPSPPPAPEEQ